MTHKKEYVVNGDKMAAYSRTYYQKHKDKIKKRAKQRLVNNPDLNKDYYKKNKEKCNALNKRNYKRKKEV